jgi:hypothetical protein
MAASPVAAKEGKFRILAQFHDFRGWDLKAVWDTTKLVGTHDRSVEHVALVGDWRWKIFRGQER